MKTADVRTAFLEYFRQQGHTTVPSSSLVPADDPTLLFTNAGMNQFKDTFLGREDPGYTRAASAQRCVRAGGKHNDLENVGFTARHHTFFEMLGNFSFGDYFKQEAIRYAWSFLTSGDWLGLPPERLWVTVYETDAEAYRIWNETIGVPAERIVRMGDEDGIPYNSDNFWSMGDTGPCGPCTEVFYDHGPEVAGGPPGSSGEDGDRYIEIWNLVFMQFNRRANGEMQNLPSPSVDTGMGLERITAVLQGLHSNYEIDLFQDLLHSVSELLGGADTRNASIRVIADHIRSCAFLIGDGVMPSNEGRGFVLRRIIRRAARHGNKLGATEPFFHRLVASLEALMGEAYPELSRARPQIEKILQQEEEQFARTLERGLRLLEDDISRLGGTEIPGETVFTLYDTFGFPVDLTNDIARERGLTLDMEGYEEAMEAQRERARAASKFGIDYNAALSLEGETDFTGYNNFEDSGQVRAVVVDGARRDAGVGERAVVVLDRTPFYAEAGGQVGDTGTLRWSGGRFEVEDTSREEGHHLHIGRVVAGEIRPGMAVDAEVNGERRAKTARNHSATHLLHAALRTVLGKHVAQKGSLVNAERLRFDFSHFEVLTQKELERIENMINEQIRANTAVETRVTDMETARSMGAMALFGEKYGDTVRVLSMGIGDFSIELCGGTHINRTGDIGLCRIVTETGISSGVRRVEALTGEVALAYDRQMEDRVERIAATVKATPETAVERVQGLAERNRAMEKEIEQLKGKLASSAGSDLALQAVDINGVKVVAADMHGADRKTLMETTDQLRNKLGKAVIVLGSAAEGKVTLVAGVTKNLTGSVRAGELMQSIAPMVGGKGGGRPDMAQGGGGNPERLPEAIAAVEERVRRAIED